MEAGGRERVVTGGSRGQVDVAASQRQSLEAGKGQ